MAWITGGEERSVHSGTAAGGGTGSCHAVDQETLTTACGVFTSRLQLWPEVPFARVRMAGAEACPTCVALTEHDHVLA